MNELEKAASKALEALESGTHHGIAIAALRRALEQPAQQDIRDAETELNCAEEVLDGDAAHLELKETSFDCIGDYIKAVFEALKAEQTVQEPVAWGVDWGKAGDITCVSIIKRLPDGGIEVVAVEYEPYQHTRPQAREPLTIEQIKKAFHHCDEGQESSELIVAFAHAIEAAHGIGEKK